MARRTPADQEYLDLVRYLERLEARALQAVVAAVEAGRRTPAWAETAILQAQRNLALLAADAATTPMTLAAAGRLLDQAWVAGSSWADIDIDAPAYQDPFVTQVLAAEAVSDTVFVDRRPRQLEALIKELHGQTSVLPVQILRAAQDQLRAVVADAAADVASGAVTVDEAAKNAVKDLRNRGVRGFTDKAGRRWKATTYARMAVRTAYTRAANEARLARYTQRQVGLVQVSDAHNECRLCRPWENQVLETEPGSGGGYPVAGSVGDAVAAGLLHPNCRHLLHAYTPGLSDQPSRAVPGETAGGLWPALP